MAHKRKIQCRCCQHPGCMQDAEYEVWEWVHKWRNYGIHGIYCKEHADAKVAEVTKMEKARKEINVEKANN